MQKTIKDLSILPQSIIEAALCLTTTGFSSIRPIGSTHYGIVVRTDRGNLWLIHNTHQRGSTIGTFYQDCASPKWRLNSFNSAGTCWSSVYLMMKNHFSASVFEKLISDWSPYKFTFLSGFL
ncbi:hypothetical protein G9A89_001633 [Geosiphon pyriformis]|nr:hypothetical protein G9A89_001633 [Geosiphon pyriformis]